MDENNRVAVEIFGEKLYLISGEDDVYIQEIAEYVDRKMVEIFKFRKYKAEKPLVQSMLLGLNIADELFKEKRRQITSIHMQEQVSEKDLEQDKNQARTKAPEQMELAATVEEAAGALPWEMEKAALLDEIKLLKARNNELLGENKRLKKELNQKAKEADETKREFDAYIEAFGTGEKAEG